MYFFNPATEEVNFQHH